MIRITAYGLLVGWGNVALWIFLPFFGTLLALTTWSVFKAFIDWRVPKIKQFEKLREADRQKALVLKAQLCDTLVEMNRAVESEKQMADVLEEMRSSNRNLNARAASALRDQTK